MMIEFIVLAIGPKHCDLEVKDIKHGKTVGRVQFDVNVQQLETMEIVMDELQVRLNGNEERPLFSEFRVITNKEMPKHSDHSSTQVGRFKKETNQTKYKWETKKRESLDAINLNALLEDEGEQNKNRPLVVRQEISLENMKNSTIQLLLKVD